MDLQVRNKIFFVLKRKFHFSLNDLEIEDMIEDAIETYLLYAPDDIKADISLTTGWLCNTAVNHGRNYRKKANRCSSLDVLVEKGRNFISNDNFEEEFIFSDGVRVLSLILTEDEKNLLDRRMEGFLFEEISLQTGLKKNTLEKRYARIMKKLKCAAHEEMIRESYGMSSRNYHIQTEDKKFRAVRGALKI